MTELAERLMSREFRPDWRNDDIDLTQTTQNRFRNVQFRSFLPTTLDRRYDLATSTFTLLELSSAEERLKTVERIWLKLRPYGFLVLIESGTKAGFDVIQESRDFLIEAASAAARKWKRGPRNPKNNDALGFIKGRYRSYGECRVISPCPHDRPCPMYKHQPVNALCMFTAKYQGPIRKGKENSAYEKAKFSYIVLRKLPSEAEKAEIVAQSLKRDAWLRGDDVLSSKRNEKATSLEQIWGKANGDTVLSDGENNHELSEGREASEWTSRNPSSVPRRNADSLKSSCSDLNEMKQDCSSDRFVVGSSSESAANGDRRLNKFKENKEVTIGIASAPPSNDDDALAAWPRVLAPPSAQRNVATVKLCLPNGELDHYHFRKAENRECYYVAKFSRWGDVLPVKVEERETVERQRKKGGKTEQFSPPD